jgi:nitroimidazol reductase NimA-like FMN-containing flavoprotein (pyridoxamine 5'-phosphate oxidase superfamily)
MGIDRIDRPFTRVRRRDRAIQDESWIRAYLHRAPWGVLATSYDGQPFVNSNLFIFWSSAWNTLVWSSLGRLRSS